MPSITAYADATNSRNDWYSPDEAWGNPADPYDDSTFQYAFNLTSQTFDELYLDLNDTTLDGLPTGATLTQIVYGATIRYKNEDGDLGYYLNLNSNANTEYGSTFKSATPDDDSYADDTVTLTSGLPSVATIKSGGLSVEVDPSGAGDGTFRVTRVWATVTYEETTIEETAEPFTAGTVTLPALAQVQKVYPEPWTHAVEYAAAQVDNEGFYTVAPWTEAVTFADPAMLPGQIEFTPGEFTHTVEFVPPSIVQVEPPVPPPIPWQTLLASDTWAQAIGARQRTTSCRVDLVDDAGSVVASFGAGSTLGGVVSGSVTCDRNRAVRWSCNLTLAEPDLVPTSVDDLLGPLSRLRARVWWLIRLEDGTWGQVPVGTYLLTEPAIADTADRFTIALTGDDAVAQIKQAKWTDMLDVGGMRVDLALAAILDDRAPWLARRITPVEDTLPSVQAAGEPGGDPWDDLTRLAAAGNLDVFIDRLGVLTAVPANRQESAVRQVGWVEGENATLLGVTHKLSTDVLLNEYLVESVSSDLQADADLGESAGVAALVRDDDPTSPMWVGHGRVYSDTYSTDTFTTVEQCRKFGESVIARRRAWISSVDLTGRARPDLDPGDLVEVQRTRSQVSGVFEVQSWSMALGPQSTMRATLAERRERWSGGR